MDPREMSIIFEFPGRKIIDKIHLFPTHVGEYRLGVDFEPIHDADAHLARRFAFLQAYNDGAIVIVLRERMGSRAGRNEPKRGNADADGSMEVAHATIIIDGMGRCQR